MRLPRYLQVAHWLQQQARPMGSREVARAFEVTLKTMSDDFAKIRKRPDLIEFTEQRVRCKGGYQYMLQVTQIHAYRLDNRLYPTRCHNTTDRTEPPLTWRDILSHHWHQLSRRLTRAERT